jgi:hypothetical protein
MRVATALVLLALLPACVVAQESKNPAEWVRETNEYYPENVPHDANRLPRYVIKHIVDSRTGAPIAGATVDVIYGISGAPRENVSKRSTVSGEDGWARIRIDDLRQPDVFFEVQADAPGYAPRSRSGGYPDDDGWLELHPSPPLLVEVVDCIGRPIAGATIVCAYFRTFPLRSAVTDADGRAVLPSTSWASPDMANVFIEKNGRNLGVQIQTVPTEQESGPLVLRCPCGRTIEGMVLAPDGRPAAGTRISIEYAWGGPLTVTTDGDGGFRLGGVLVPNIYHDACISVLAFGLGMDAFQVAVPAAGEDLLIHLPGPTGATSKPMSEAPPSPRKGASSGQTQVPLFLEGFPDDGVIEVVSEGVDVFGVSSIEHKGDAPISVTVPVDGPCALVLSADMRTKIVEVPASARKAATLSSRREPVVVKWFRPSIVKFRLAAPDGSPISGRASVNWRFAETNGNLFAIAGTPTIEPPPAKEVHEISTGLRGPVWLTAVATDRSLRAVARRIVLPDDGGVHDLGEVRFATKDSTSLRVLRPDGSAAAGARVILRHFGHQRGWWEPEADGSLNEFHWWCFEPNAGMVLQLDAIGFPIAVLRRPEGQGPWTFRFPNSAIDVSVRDSNGAAVDKFWVRVDRHRLSGNAGHLAIAGVEPGPHRLVIAAPGHRARVEQLLLKTDEVRTIDAVLKPFAGESAPTQPR